MCNVFLKKLFIQQGYITLIKRYSNNIHNVTNSASNSCFSVALSINHRILKRVYLHLQKNIKKLSYM